MRHQTFDWNAIEPRIRPHVKALIDAGYRTTGSCGHEMWINVAIEPHEIPKLCADMKRLGYRDFEVSYTHHDGYEQWQGGKVQFGGELAGDQKPFDYVLLQVDPESHPLYFVVKARVWEGHERTPERDSYFYDEHTCPANWLDEIVAVVSHRNVDPHGFAKFVRRFTPPDDFEADSDPWLDAFPEIVGHGLAGEVGGKK